MKMDELYQANNNLEMLISKIKRYNTDLYKQSMNLDQVELRRQIGVRNKELEAFPRQNKNCIEYYEKYKLKYEELDSKFTQQQKTEDQITELLNALREKKAKSIEENFKLLSKNFTEIFRDIVKDGSATLKLVKQDLSQQSEQSQFPDGS